MARRLDDKERGVDMARREASRKGNDKGGQVRLDDKG
jgi:hypothetical protein